MYDMKKNPGIHTLVSAIIFLFVLNYTFPQNQNDLKGLDIRINEYLSGLAAADQFSGSVLVAAGGKVLFSQGYNLANREHGIPNTPGTKYRLGSLSMQFTAMAVMILQEQGRLRVHDFIARYIPDCPPSWHGITIHHLLTHSSGIPGFEYFPDNLYFERLPTNVEKTIERFKYNNLLFAPGSDFSFSSSGYVLLGYIIEKVTGESYENVLKHYIFDPLGMKNTGYDHPRVILRDRAQGYTIENETLLNAIHFAMDTPFSAGALYSTVEDLFIWDHILSSTKLISENSLNAMFSKQVPVADNGYGYGWRVRRMYNRNLVDHNGVISGFQSNFYRFPNEKISIISLSNFEFSNLSRINTDLAALIFDAKLN
jgi:CubicO group peptidase (beta-lactamase class C family)